jgi:hypothetical protein
MAIDRNGFFGTVRETVFGGRLSKKQVMGCEAILDAWEHRTSTGDRRWLAYMLATTYHETAATMQPVRETLAATDAAASARLERAGAGGGCGRSARPIGGRTRTASTGSAGASCN